MPGTALQGMRDLFFEHVVIKSPRSGMVLNVSSVKEAGDLLAHFWAKQCGPYHLAATDVCSRALAGKASAVEARLAFVEAAREIDVYVLETTQTSRRSLSTKVNAAAFSEMQTTPFPKSGSS